MSGCVFTKKSTNVELNVVFWSEELFSKLLLKEIVCWVIVELHSHRGLSQGLLYLAICRGRRWKAPVAFLLTITGSGNNNLDCFHVTSFVCFLSQILYPEYCITALVIFKLNISFTINWPETFNFWKMVEIGFWYPQWSSEICWDVENKYWTWSYCCLSIWLNLV